MTKKSKEPLVTAIILVIGNEILNGKTLDTNSQFLSEKLFKRGITVIRRITIPDDLPVMVEEIRANSSHCDYLFAMGGLGPTPDDLTRQAFADAFNVPLVRHIEAEKLMRQYKAAPMNEIRLRMADLPEGCDLIHNPYLGAPGFIIKNCFVFPGIPELLIKMFENILEKLPEIPRFMKKMRINYREGDFADIMTEVQSMYQDVNIGSYPAFRNPEFKVELTFDGRDEKKIDESMAKFTEMLENLKTGN